MVNREDLEPEDRPEYDRLMAAINIAEQGLMTALTGEFNANADTDEDIVVLDYLVVAKIINEDGQMSFRLSVRNDSLLVESAGLAQYAQTYLLECLRERTTGGSGGGFIG